MTNETGTNNPGRSTKSFKSHPQNRHESHYKDGAELGPSGINRANRRQPGKNTAAFILHRETNHAEARGGEDGRRTSRPRTVSISFS